MYTSQNKNSFFLKLAFQQAEINLGSTSLNPSVGCIIVKNNSVISSGKTSFNGRPHAEADALQKKKNVKGASMYITLEPCSHYGKTPPCVNKIISQKLHKVIFSINDIDERSKNLAYTKLKKAKINIKRFILTDYANFFYRSYLLQFSKQAPLIDAKLAVSEDYLTINKKQKWITNSMSRKTGNFLRSKYDCIVSTAKTVNYDNSSLDCRIEGLEHKSPAVIIIDRSFKIKKKLKVFRNKSRKIFIFTHTNNKVKENFFKKIGVEIIKFNKTNNLKKDLSEVYFCLKKLGFNRILIESGAEYTNEVLKHKLIENFYLFKSPLKLKNRGRNNINPHLIRKLKTTIKNKVKINLNGDSLYKIQL